MISLCVSLLFWVFSTIHLPLAEQGAVELSFRLVLVLLLIRFSVGVGLCVMDHGGSGTVEGAWAWCCICSVKLGIAGEHVCLQLGDWGEAYELCCFGSYFIPESRN